MGIALTFLGHAGVLLDDGTHAVAIDPFLTGNPLATRKAGDIHCQAIVLTHGHSDHVGDTIAIAKANGATVYATYEVTEFLDEAGVETEPGNTGGRIVTPFGWVAFTPAFHSSSYKGRYLGMPCGVMVHLGGVTAYHCGPGAPPGRDVALRLTLLISATEIMGGFFR